MAVTITNDDIKAFDVSNKFGFLNISDSEDEEKSWQKPKKPAKQRQSFKLTLTVINEVVLYTGQ